MKKEFDFAKEFGEIDERLVRAAGKEWKPQKRHFFWLYSRKIAGVAALALLIAAAGNSKVQAAAKEFTTKIGEAFGFTKDLSSYAELINQTQDKNGISLTLKEVIADDRVLMVSVYAAAEPGEEPPLLWVNEEETTINGQTHTAQETMASVFTEEGAPEWEQNNVLAQIYEDQILPEGEVHVHLVLEAEKNNAAASFAYDFITTSEELKEKTVKQTLHMTVGKFGAEQKELVFKELTMNDLYCRILTEGFTETDGWLSQYEIKLKGTDSLGNPVSLTGGKFLSNGEMLFTTDFMGDYENGEIILNDEFQMSVLDKSCEYLDLQLYERKLIPEAGGEDDACGIQEFGSLDSAYSKEENYGWKAAGKPFRIFIKQDKGGNHHEE